MRRLRVDLRLLAAAFLALVAGLGTYAATRPPDRIAVLQSAASLPHGVPIAHLAWATANREPAPGLVTADRLDELSEWVLRVPLAEGIPLVDAMLAPPNGAYPDAMGITLERAHAVQGDLQPGDTVDVYVTDEESTTLLASSVIVLDVKMATGGFSGDEVSLILAVDDSLTRPLADALNTATLDLVRVSR